MRVVKLTDPDKEQLKNWGFTDQDIKQISVAIGHTVYTFKSERIAADKALDVLGRVAFLSGIGRSAFHFTAAREAKDNSGDVVYFDSSRLFK